MDLFEKTSTRSGAFFSLLFFLVLISCTLAASYPIVVIDLIKNSETLCSRTYWINPFRIPSLILGGVVYYLIFRDYFACLKRIAARERSPKGTTRF